MPSEPTAEYRTRVRVTEVEAYPALEITPESYYREVFGDEPIPADIAASIVSVPDRLLKAYDALGTARAEVHRAIMEHATREHEPSAAHSHDPNAESRLAAERMSSDGRFLYPGDPGYENAAQLATNVPAAAFACPSCRGQHGGHVHGCPEASAANEQRMCPACGGFYKLRKDGTLPKHSYRPGSHDRTGFSRSRPRRCPRSETIP